MPSKNIVEIKNLTKKFGTLTAVDNVSLGIREGEIFGILGPNGSGKTTTINMLLAILTPTSGSMTISGMDVRKNREGIKRLIGLMTQETIVEADLTARENLILFSRLYDIPEVEIDQRVRRGLEDAGLLDFANARAGTFSGGMKRRLGLVRALLQEPKILVLDEPTTGLDIQNRLTMWERIKALNKKGGTVILTTQYLEEADELCDRIAIMDHGRLISLGTPSEIKELVGGVQMLELVVEIGQVQKVASLLRTRFKINATVKNDRITAVLNKKESARFTEISRMLDRERINVLSRGLHLPTLDDVFIKLTGAKTRDRPGAMRGGQASVRWK